MCNFHEISENWEHWCVRFLWARPRMVNVILLSSFHVLIINHPCFHPTKPPLNVAEWSETEWFLENFIFLGEFAYHVASSIQLATWNSSVLTMYKINLIFTVTFCSFTSCTHDDFEGSSGSGLNMEQNFRVWNYLSKSEYCGGEEFS